MYICTQDIYAENMYLLGAYCIGIYHAIGKYSKRGNRNFFREHKQV